MVTTRYVVEHGMGHYVVSNGITTISCDEGELHEIQKDLMEEIL